MNTSTTPEPGSLSSSSFSFRSVLSSLAWTFVFNTVIAGFLHLVGAFDTTFSIIFIISQCVGLSICLSVKILFSLLTPTWGPLKLLLLLAGILVGTLIGIGTSTRVVGEALGEVGRYCSPQGEILILGLFFGVIIAYFFISRERLSRSEIEAREERLQRVTLEKLATETELKLLQAQIEPHFLFNTLSNLTSLLETDVDTARRMLDNLIHYLRTSLTASRRDTITLEQEMDLIRAYLQIYHVRMGERLQFELLLPDDLKPTPFSPMLIQPLVENAIKHGLEPKVEGGKISVTVSKSKDRLLIQVADTGLGLQGETSAGVGLDNVRQRMATLYGQAGQLSLTANPDAGVTAIIEVPCD